VTLTSTKRIGALAVAASLFVAACGGGGATSASGESQAPGESLAADLSGTVAIDGSSTVFPITQAVAEEFQKEHPGVQVPVAFSGTGGGFKKFCNGETDLNDASRPIKTEDSADAKSEASLCDEAGVDWVELQVAIDGLTVVVNPENDFASCLTVDELARIYGPDSSENLLWSDVRADFPAETVERYMPGADSGTFDYFTEEINGETDVATQFATQSEDDNVLVTGVSGSRYAIGFYGYAYYVENPGATKALEIDGGAGCVGPTPETINNNTYAPLSRPLFIYPDAAKAADRPELTAFVDYYLANTNALSAEVGYIPLPDDALAAEVAKWMAATGR
jgi:phosphate transport system substrate-binding protein